MSHGHQNHHYSLSQIQKAHDEASYVVNNTVCIHITAGELIHVGKPRNKTPPPRFLRIISCLLWLSNCSSVDFW